MIGELATQKPFPITLAGTTQNSTRAVFSQVRPYLQRFPAKIEAVWEEESSFLQMNKQMEKWVKKE